MQSNVFLPPFLKVGWGGIEIKVPPKSLVQSQGVLVLSQTSNIDPDFKMKIRRHEDWRMLPPTTYCRHY